MKNLGYFLVGVGATWLVWALFLETSVSAGGFSVGGHYIAHQQVANLSLMEVRRTHLMLSGGTTLIGVLLMGFGKLTERRR